MLDGLYQFFRGASGFSFLVIGTGYLVQPRAARVRKALGALYLALGAAFMLSWFSENWLLPLAVDNALLIGSVYVISQSMFEISLYLFGGEAVRGSRRRVYLIGAAWSLALFALPLLDQVFKLPVLQVNIEDARPMALFQSIGSIGVYVWPIVITIVSLRAGRWRLADLPLGPGAVRAVLGGIAAAMAILCAIGLALILNSRSLYRSAHSALELLMLLWFWFFQANPDTFLHARLEIGQRHKQRAKIGADEASAITGRLRQVVQVDRIYEIPDLKLPMLAKAIHIPAYRLSAYFNSVVGSSFPEWLNGVRVDRVKQLLEDEPGRSILDISLEAGYASKAVFNSQFLRFAGMSPREYRSRKRHGHMKKIGTDSLNQVDSAEA